jgi:hypothetical protein
MEQAQGAIPVALISGQAAVYAWLLLMKGSTHVRARD